ncbi:MAG TPA: hypothetical protein VKA30_00315 [Actinomycetota bacterium]|nr:hypothetical protein [Actinomycetota bacterium]
MTSPTQEQLKELVRSEKPAFFAKGRTTDPDRGLTFTALHDGQGNWFIERPNKMEFKSAGRTILVERHRVAVIDIPVAANNDVKGNLDGKRIAYLNEGSLEITGTTEMLGRPCFEIRAWGLKQGDDQPFEMVVDRETGLILRLSQGEALFEVTELRMGVPVDH